MVNKIFAMILYSVYAAIYIGMRYKIYVPLVVKIMPTYTNYCQHHMYSIISAGANHKVVPDDLVAQSQRGHIKTIRTLPHTRM